MSWPIADFSTWPDLGSVSRRWVPTALLSCPGRFVAVQADFLAVQVDFLAVQGHFLAVQADFLADRLIF